MRGLPRTEEALNELIANQPRGTGTHAQEHARRSRSGRMLGYVPFNPIRHLPTDITPFSPMAVALGHDEVRKIQPTRPLNANIVLDFQAKNELPGVTKAKVDLAKDLRQTLDDALTNPHDRLQVYTLGRLGTYAGIQNYAEPLTSDTRPEAAREALESLASRDFTVVVSDFEWLSPAQDTENTLRNAVAIKVNHRFERELPAKIGMFSLGGWAEVNTDKRRELAAANRDLAAHHDQVVAGLEAAGASVASVVFDPRLSQGFDVLATDQAIAQAVKAKHA